MSEAEGRFGLIHCSLALCLHTGGVSDIPIGEETLGQTLDMLEGLYHSAGLGAPRYSPGRVSGCGWVEECLGFLAETVAPATWTLVKLMKMMKATTFQEPKTQTILFSKFSLLSSI